MDFTYAIRGSADLDDIRRGMADMQAAMQRMAGNSDRSAAAVQGAMGRMSGAIGLATSAASALGAALGIGALAGRIKAAAQAGAELGAEYKRMSTTVGTTVEEFAGLAAAFGEVGLESDAVMSVLGELQQRAVNAPDDFARWGISVREANGAFSDSMTLLERYADRMAEATSATERMAMADELLSEEGRVLIPVLRDGSEALRQTMEAAKAAGLAVTDYEAVAGRTLIRAQRTAARQTEALGSALSGILSPALSLITEEVGRASAETAEWIRANQELIDEKVQSFLISFADDWIPAIAQGIVYATRAARGFQLIWFALQKVAAKAFEVFSEGFAFIVEVGADAARAFGQDGLAGELEAMGQVQRMVASDFAGDQDKINAKIGEALDAQIELEAAIGRLGERGSEAVRRVAARVSDLTRSLREAAAAAPDAIDPPAVELGEDPEDAQKKAHEAAMARMRAEEEYGLWKRGFELQVAEYTEARYEREKQLEDEARERAKAEREKQLADMQQFANAAASTMGSLVTAAISGGQSVTEVMKGLGTQLVQLVMDQLTTFVTAKLTEQAVTKATAATNITASAAEAGAGAAKAVAGVPIAGPGLAIAAMAAVSAAVLGLLQTLNTGGVVQGRSSMNRDSVLLAATPGEAVLDRETTQRLAQILGAGGAAPAPRERSSGPALASTSGAGGGGGSVVVQTLMPPSSRVEQIRLERRLERLVRSR